MDKVTVYHNPACSKSRGALALLAERHVACEVIEYLKTPPDRPTLDRLLGTLDGVPADLVRKDKRFRELDLDPRAFDNREAVVTLLLEHPELMERPVVVCGGRAVIARPPERALELLDEATLPR